MATIADELVILVVLVVGGVQHVDCVTFSNLNFPIKRVIKERKREREREKEKEKEKEKDKEKGKGKGKGKEKGKGKGKEKGRGRGRGSALEKFAAIVNPDDKPTKVNWTLSWPVPWNFVENLFLKINKLRV